MFPSKTSLIAQLNGDFLVIPDGACLNNGPDRFDYPSLLSDNLADVFRIYRYLNQGVVITLNLIDLNILRVIHQGLGYL
jgi:hypothetical protein